MDYTRYEQLMDRYNALRIVGIDSDETRDSLISKLMDSSFEKKQIAGEVNTIVGEYITKYEENPEQLDAEGAAVLEDLLDRLAPKDRGILDISAALRLGRVLLDYYQSIQDLEQTVRILERCATIDIFMKSHAEDFESSPYSLMAEQYLDRFDELSLEGKKMLARCWLLCVLNQKDRTFGLSKFGEIRERFIEFRRKMGKDFMIDAYILCENIVLEMALGSCLRAEYAKTWDVEFTEPVIDLTEAAPVLEMLRQDQEMFLAEWESHFQFDRITTRLHIAQIDYRLGKITVEELLERIRECTLPQEEYTPYEQISALFAGNIAYLDYLYMSSSYDRQYVLDEGTRIIEHVLGNLDGIAHDYGPVVGAIQINHNIIEFMGAASRIVDFDIFKGAVLNATVYADKPLYVHTMMVKEISLVLLDYILEHDPIYLDGVAGYSWEYLRDHKQYFMELMEDCALFHDIGKYFCLDIVSNSSRRLTDEEFELVKHHPINFSSVYQGAMTPEIGCIRDCALLHHLWYNEQGGYPRQNHTANKPFVNILTVADCIDAATDNIGRPYGQRKTLEQVMKEFDDSRNVRYSGFVSDLLHKKRIRDKISHVIGDRRKDIYCEIYLGTE